MLLVEPLEYLTVLFSWFVPLIPLLLNYLSKPRLGVMNLHRLLQSRVKEQIWTALMRLRGS